MLLGNLFIWNLNLLWRNDSVLIVAWRLLWILKCTIWELSLKAQIIRVYLCRLMILELDHYSLICPKVVKRKIWELMILQTQLLWAQLWHLVKIIQHFLRWTQLVDRQIRDRMRDNNMNSVNLKLTLTGARKHLVMLRWVQWCRQSQRSHTSLTTSQTLTNIMTKWTRLFMTSMTRKNNCNDLIRLLIKSAKKIKINEYC